MIRLVEDSDGIKVIMGLVTSVTRSESLAVVTDAEVSMLCKVALLDLLVVEAPGNPETLGDIVRVDSAVVMEAHKPVVPVKIGEGVTLRMIVLVSVPGWMGREAVSSEAPDEDVVPRSPLLSSVTDEFKRKFVISGTLGDTV